MCHMNEQLRTERFIKYVVDKFLDLQECYIKILVDRYDFIEEDEQSPKLTLGQPRYEVVTTSFS